MMTMRSLRLILALVLAASLAVMPMSAGMAMSYGAKAEMGMSEGGQDCPCCNALHKCAPDTCMLKCFSAAAMTVDGPLLEQPLPQLFLEIGAPTPSPFSTRPDPPPPRS